MKKTLKAKKTEPTLNLPMPAHEYGYTVGQIDSFMTEDERRRFNEWMDGQTCMYDPKVGSIVYTHDVERFLRMVRFKQPTYFD